MNNIFEQIKVNSADNENRNYFGNSASISSDGNTAIVSAHGDDSYRGSAYIFTRSGSTWTQQAKLLASDGQNNDYFGWSVSISGDGNTAIVGAHGDDNSKGSAYIFTRSGSIWTQQTKLLVSDRVGVDLFGYSVSISSDGNTAIVGAYGCDAWVGSTYIFTRSGSSWTQQAKLLTSDGQNNDYFGHSVFISSDGNTAIAGAHRDDNYRGSAYIFTRSGSSWIQQNKLLASDGIYGDLFGWSVSISADGNTAIAGAYYDDNLIGSAYIFTRSGSTWTQQTKLLASDGTSGDRFGHSVSISADGNTAIVGAFGDDGGRGSAYVFTRSGSSWIQQNKWLASDGVGSDRFGISVSISADSNAAIVGVHADDSSRGSAYIFTRSGRSLNE